MKKLIALLCVVMCIAIMPLSASAVYYDVVENDPITLPKGAPVIDGVINDNEGWSADAWLNYETHSGAWGTNPLTGTVKFNLAYTDQGVYLGLVVEEIGSAYMVRFYDADGNTDYDASYIDPNAGSYTCTPGGYPSTTPDGTPIEHYLLDHNTTSAPAGVTPKNCFTYTFTGNSFQLCTGEDDVDAEYGFNGDTFGLCIDLLGAWEYEGFLGLTDYLPMYNVGLFTDGSVRVARSLYNNSDITEQCSAAGVATENGAVIEVMIPWDIIVEDQNDCGAVFGLEQEFTVEDVTAEGATHRATLNWQDRFYDPDAEMMDTWGRFITTCRTTSAGNPGHSLDIASYGLKLVMGSASGTVDTTTTAGDDTTTAPAGDDDTTTAPAGNDTTKAGETTKKPATTTKKGATTTKAASTGKPSTGTSSTQTFDAGIAVAVGALAISAIGYVGAKKSKKH